MVVSHALAVLPIFNRQHSMRFRSTLCCSHFMIYVCLELHYKGGFQHIFCQCDTHLFIEGEFWKRGILSPMLPERGRKIDDLILHSRLICNCVRGKQISDSQGFFVRQHLIIHTMHDSHVYYASSLCSLSAKQKLPTKNWEALLHISSSVNLIPPTF